LTDAYSGDLRHKQLKPASREYPKICVIDGLWFY